MPKLFAISALVFVFFSSFIFSNCNAQSAHNDFEILNSHKIKDRHFDKRNPNFMLPNTKYTVVKYNPVSLFLGSAMYVYQGFISSQLYASCLFSPSCSEMSKHFIHDFGLIKGTALTADRLTRCNRIAATNVHQIRISQTDNKIRENSNMFRIKKKKK